MTDCMRIVHAPTLSTLSSPPHAVLAVQDRPAVRSSKVGAHKQPVHGTCSRWGQCVSILEHLPAGGLGSLQAWCMNFGQHVMHCSKFGHAPPSRSRRARLAAHSAPCAQPSRNQPGSNACSPKIHQRTYNTQTPKHSHTQADEHVQVYAYTNTHTHIHTHACRHACTHV